MLCPLKFLINTWLRPFDGFVKKYRRFSKAPPPGGSLPMPLFDRFDQKHQVPVGNCAGSHLFVSRHWENVCFDNVRMVSRTLSLIAATPVSTSRIAVPTHLHRNVAARPRQHADGQHDKYRTSTA